MGRFICQIEFLGGNTIFFGLSENKEYKVYMKHRTVTAKKSLIFIITTSKIHCLLVLPKKKKVINLTQKVQTPSTAMNLIKRFLNGQI